MCVCVRVEIFAFHEIVYFCSCAANTCSTMRCCCCCERNKMRQRGRERETAIEREVGKAKSRNQHFVAADCCFVFLYSSYSLFRLFVLHTKFDNCGSGEGVSLFNKKKEEEKEN